MGNDIGGTATQNANAEWIELYNNGSSTVNLTGWNLSWGSININLGVVEGNTQNIYNTEIFPGGFFLLERTTNNSVPGISADLIYTGALTNTGVLVTLRDSEGTTKDTVDGSDGWKINGDGVVIGKNESPKETAQRTSNGWATFLPTPKSQNSQ